MTIRFIAREPDTLWYNHDIRRFRFGFMMVSPVLYDAGRREVDEWCQEHVGEYGPKGLWYTHDATFWFVHEDHAMEFKLRWV